MSVNNFLNIIRQMCFANPNFLFPGVSRNGRNRHFDMKLSVCQNSIDANTQNCSFWFGTESAIYYIFTTM